MPLYVEEYIKKLQQLPPKTEVVAPACLLVPSPGMVERDIREHESKKERASVIVNQLMKDSEVQKNNEPYNLIASKLASIFDVKEEYVSCAEILWEGEHICKGEYFVLSIRNKNEDEIRLHIRFDDKYVATLQKET